MTTETEGLGIAAAIANLRDELEKAIDEGKHKVTPKLKIEGSNRMADFGARRRKTSAEVGSSG